MTKKYSLRFSYSIIFLYLFTFSAQAQIKLPPKQVEQKAPVKQTVTEVKPVSTGPVFTLKVMSNVACKFYVDGELKATVAQDDIEKLQLKAGEYMFKAVATENSSVVFKEFFTVTKEQIGTEKFYKIDLQSVIDEADQEAAAKRAAAQRIAEQKAAAQKIEFERAEEKLRQENAEAEREAKRLEYLEEMKKKGLNQKPFEGKMIINSDWENVPQDMKEYYKQSTRIEYYKPGKMRMDMHSSDIVTTIMIFDYDKGESLTLSEITIGAKTTKTATLQKINTPNTNDYDLTVEYLDDFKTIAGYECQKINYISYNKKEQKTTENKMYVYTGFSTTTSGNWFSGTNIVPFLSVESEMPIAIKEQTSIFRSSPVSISEEPVSDDLFSLTPPRGYTFTDKR